MRRIFAEEEIPRKNFWKRQFDPDQTPGQATFDGIFGVILPVLCFVADPAIFKGLVLGPPFLRRYQLLAYLVAVLEMGVFIVWRTFRKHLTTFSAPFAGVLFAGGLFSTAIGILILPLSAIGLLVLIGIFGFVPFLTAFVYFRSAVRAMKDQVNNSTFEFRFLTAGLAGLLVIVLSVWGSMFLQPLFPELERTSQSWVVMDD